MRPDPHLPGPASSAEEDTCLLAAVKAGREEALQQLHRRYAPLVFHLACRSLDRPAAEEVVQDTFLALWRKARDYDPARGSVRTWLLSIGHHRMLDELRSRARRPLSAEAPPEPWALSDDAPLPDEALWREVQREAVDEAVAALPGPQREALRLAFFADLSHEEVARALQVPLGTAKTRIRRGLQLLERHLGGLVALLLVALGGGGVWLYRRHTAEDGRTARALHLLADSQTRALRLLPPGGASTGEAGLHAAFRSAPGSATAVLTLSRFPAPPPGLRYRLWIRSGRGWGSLELEGPGRDGRGLQILEAPWLAQAWPLELRIIAEPGPGAQPSGPGLVAWREEGPRPAQP